MNIACYCRVSTEKESQVDSLENQKEFFVDYAKKNGHNLVKLYADEGISGTKLKNRKQFLLLMKEANLGIFNAVVVKDVSRFARNTVDLLQNVRTLKSLGINVNFITSDMNTLGESEFILTVFGAFAQEESLNVSKRVKFAKDINAEKGRVPNQVYGYNKIIGDYFNLNINEEESDIIKDIFNMYINGYGAYKISLKLNERGLRTKRGKLWSQNAINRILQNQIYIGKVTNKKEEVKDFLTGKREKLSKDNWIVTNKPELAIIDLNTFNKAQKMLKENNEKFNHFNKKNATKYVFSTLIKCKCCGYSFRRMEKIYKNTYVRWCCSGRNKNGSGFCENKFNIDEDSLIYEIKEYLKTTINNKEETINYIEQQQKIINSNSKKTLSNLNKELHKLNKNKEKNMIMFNNDVISIEELKELSGPLNSKIFKIEMDIKLLENNELSCTKIEINKQFDLIEKIINSDTLENNVLKQIIDVIEVDENGHIDIRMKYFEM